MEVFEKLPNEARTGRNFLSVIREPKLGKIFLIFNYFGRGFIKFDADGERFLYEESI